MTGRILQFSAAWCRICCVTIAVTSLFYTLSFVSFVTPRACLRMRENWREIRKMSRWRLVVWEIPKLSRWILVLRMLGNPSQCPYFTNRLAGRVHVEAPDWSTSSFSDRVAVMRIGYKSTILTILISHREDEHTH